METTVLEIVAPAIPAAANTANRSTRKPMKNVRIELHVTAFVHVAEGITEGVKPIGLPFHTEELTHTRIVPLLDSAILSSDSNQVATVKAHAVSMIAGLAHVLPDKLSHGARKL